MCGRKLEGRVPTVFGIDPSELEGWLEAQTDSAEPGTLKYPPRVMDCPIRINRHNLYRGLLIQRLFRSPS